MSGLSLAERLQWADAVNKLMSVQPTSSIGGKYVEALARLEARPSKIFPAAADVVGPLDCMQLRG